MPSDTTPRRSAAWPSVPLLTLALLGCPADDRPSGDASGGQGSGSSGVEATSAPSATGTLPPSTTSSGSTEGVDSTASTTLGASTGSTSSDDLGASTGVSGCDDNGQCCGNGIIDATERCDCGMMPCTPEGLGFAECAGLFNPAFPDRVYTGGILDCSPASCQLLFTTCTFCGDENLNGNETCELDSPPVDTCASLGLGDATEPLPCDESCQLDTSSCA